MRFVKLIECLLILVHLLFSKPSVSVTCFISYGFELLSSSRRVIRGSYYMAGIDLGQRSNSTFEFESE